MKILEMIREAFASKPAGEPAMTPPTSAVVGEISATDRWLAPVGVKFTADEVRQKLRAAHDGDLRPLLAFYSEMRATDPHLDAELRKAESFLMQSSLEVLPFPSEAEGADETIATKVASYVREQTMDPDVRIDRAIEVLTGGLWSGVAGVQLVVEPGAGPDGMEKVRALVPVPQERFAYVPRTVDLAVQTGANPQDLTPIGALGASLVVLVADEHVLSPARRGILRRCLIPWLIKRNGVDWWARFVELFGIPLRKGKFRPGDLEAQALLESILERAGTAPWMAIPDSADVEFLNGLSTAGSDETHEKLVDYCERSMSKVILGATQTTDVRPGAGSKQSADSQFAVVETFCDAYGREVCEVLRRQFFRPLVARNFGEDVAEKFTPVPRLRVKSPENLLSFAEGLERLAAAGLKIPTGFVYESTGIPWPKEGEEVLEVSAPPPSPFAPALPGEPEEKPGKASPEPQDAPEDEEDPNLEASASGGAGESFAARKRPPEASLAPALDALEAKAERFGRKAGEDLVAPFRDLIDAAVEENLDANTLAVRVLHRARSTAPAVHSLADLLAAIELEAIAAGVKDARRERRTA